MEQLLERNAEGELRAGPAGRGFYDGRRRCKGTTKLLRRFLRKGLRKPIPRVMRAGWRLMVSSRTTGTTIHRILLHGIVCELGTCICDTAGAPPPDTRIRAQMYSRACLAAGREFLCDAGLTPVAGEVIVAHPRFPVATRIDLVCRNAHDHCVLVSWKSGGGPANECERQRHATQVAFEWSMVEAAGERVAAAHVVYVGGMMRGGSIAPYYHSVRVERDEARTLADAFAAWLERRRVRKERK